MGYVMGTEGVKFFIPAEHAEAALGSMVALSLADTSELGESYADALAKALADIGYGASVTEDGVKIRYFRGMADDRIYLPLVALAPYVAEGSYVEWIGEDGDRNRDIVRDGAVWHQSVKSIIWKDDKVSHPPQFITSIPITYRASATESVSGWLDLDGLMNRTKFLALRAALHKLRFYKPDEVALAPLTPGAGKKWHEADIDSIETDIALPNKSLAGDNRITAGPVDAFIAKLTQKYGSAEVPQEAKS